MNVKLKNVNL